MVNPSSFSQVNYIVKKLLLHAAEKHSCFDRETDINLHSVGFMDVCVQKDSLTWTHTVLLLRHTHLWRITCSHSGMNMRLQTRWLTAPYPHQLIMVTIIGVINRPNYRPITEALLSEGEDGGLLLRCSAPVRHFGLDPSHPLNPSALFPTLIPSCLHYQAVEVTLCKGQGLEVTLSLRRAPKIGAVWF